MKKALAALVVALGTLVVMPTAHAAEAVRILVAGDSITQGYSGDYTWRYFLDHSLRDAGTAFDLVGTRTSAFRTNDDGTADWHYDGPDAYADPDFDQDHMSYWGGSLDDSGFLYESGEQIARATAPDVMIGAYGANDLLNVDAETMLDRYQTWIVGARSVDPDIDFVIAALPWTWRSPEVARFNAALDGWAGEQTTDTSSVVVARMTEDYSQADTRDGIHPNVVGYRKIARMMAPALGQLGIAAAEVKDPAPAGDPAPVAQPEIPAPAVAVAVAPAAPAPASVAPSPPAPRGVKAVRHGSRVKVSWRGAAERYIVRCGSKTRSTSAHRTALRSTSAKCSVQAVSEGMTSSRATVRVKR